MRNDIIPPDRDNEFLLKQIAFRFNLTKEDLIELARKQNMTEQDLIVDYKKHPHNYIGIFEHYLPYVLSKRVKGVTEVNLQYIAEVLNVKEVPKETTNKESYQFIM